MGNSLYGKTAQGVKVRTEFDPRTGGRREIGTCQITNPFIASHISGIVRASVSELMSQKPTIYVATDGFVTSATADDLPLKAPIARMMSEAREFLSGSPEFVEPKYVIDQGFTWSTRGFASIKFQDKPKVARGGIKTPRGDANAWLLKLAVERTPETKIEREDPVAFPLAHRKNLDHRFAKRVVKGSMEYDYKRKLVAPRMQNFQLDGQDFQHIACDTVPWGCVEEFNAVRDQWDRWRRTHVLKTMEDWRDWMEYGRLPEVTRLKGGAVTYVIFEKDVGENRLSA